MSTKIRFAYKLKNLDLNEWITFVHELREELLEPFKNVLYKAVVDEFKDIIGELLNYRSLYDGSDERTSHIDNYLRELYVRSASHEKLLANCLYGEHQDAKMIREWSESTTFLNHILDQYLRSLNWTSTDCYTQSQKDMRSRIAWMSDGKNTLFVCHGEEFSKLVDELVASGSDFVQRYEIEAYDYYNDCDHPSTVSDEEWKTRRITWEKAYKNAFSSADAGVSGSDLYDPYEFFSVIKACREPENHKIISLLPTLEEIVEFNVRRECIQNFIENDPEYNGRLSVLIRLTNKYVDKFEAKNDKMLEWAEQRKKELLSVAPSLKSEEILVSHISELLPAGYMNRYSKKVSMPRSYTVTVTDSGEVDEVRLFNIKSSKGIDTVIKTMALSIMREKAKKGSYPQSFEIETLSEETHKFNPYEFKTVGYILYPSCEVAVTVNVKTEYKSLSESETAEAEALLRFDMSEDALKAVLSDDDEDDDYIIYDEDDGESEGTDL